VAKLVRGMRVEDALLQLQVTVKRAAKTVYQVMYSSCKHIDIFLCIMLKLQISWKPRWLYHCRLSTLPELMQPIITGWMQIVYL